MGYTLAQQQRKVRENLEHLGYKVTVMVVTKVTAFSASRQHSRGCRNHGSRSSGSDESDGFFKYFIYYYHHWKN